MANTAANLVGAELQFGNITNGIFTADNESRIDGSVDNRLVFRTDSAQFVKAVTIGTTLNVTGAITASGGVAGNASTATKWLNARTITITGGDITGQVTLDGSSNVNLPLVVNAAAKWRTPRTITMSSDLSGSVSLDGSSNVTLPTTVTRVRGVPFHTGTSEPTGTTRLNMNGYFYATRVYNAVWNDIADFITVEDDTVIEFGKVYVKDKSGHRRSMKYAEPGALGVASDTYGFGVGEKQGKKQVPIAIGGFVLAYVDKDYPSGTPLTCTTGGYLSKANVLVRLFHPECILGTYYRTETAAEWNGIAVDKRAWIKVS